MTGYLNVVGRAAAQDWLKQLPDCSVDAVVTDPPYGLGEQPPPLEVFGAWLRGKDYAPKGAGFMDAEWDAFVPQPGLWREVFRVLKPGGYLLAFFGSRTYDWGTLAIRVAGFEVTDCLQWIYATGFPKSLDISKAVDAHLTGGRSDSIGLRKTNEEVRTGEGRVRERSHNNGIVTGPDTTHTGPRIIRETPATPEGERWKGWGSALKPAYEPILVARKPLDGTYAENVLKHGVGGLNVDACRIACEGGSPSIRNRETAARTGGVPSTSGFQRHGCNPETYVEQRSGELLGRWPANVLLSHHPDCVQVGVKSVKTNGHHPAARGKGGVSTSGHAGQDGLLERRPGSETVENWKCVDDCPTRLLDAQSTVAAPKKGRVGKRGGSAWHGRSSFGSPDKEGAWPDDPGGGVSRFFYCAKADAKERWLYCRQCKIAFCRSNADEQDSHSAHAGEVVAHPTQKPVELMKWLVKLVTPAGGVVLDPFCGTGSTSVAAKLCGFNFVTCDLSEDFTKIAQARLATTDMTSATRTAAGYFCPGCKSKGQIKLIDRAVVDVARSQDKKITCVKCLGRYTAEELEAS